MSQTLEDRIKDPGSAITHFIGMLMAIFAAFLSRPLMSRGGYMLSLLQSMRQA